MQIQLVATAGPSGTVPLQQVNPDGSMSPFSLAEGRHFNLTDISIQREEVLPGPNLFSVSIVQTPGTLHQLRWCFVGNISQNVERSFNTGMLFSTPFWIENMIEDPKADAVVVRLWGEY
jgi:hypothetical protein